MALEQTWLCCEAEADMAGVYPTAGFEQVSAGDLAQGQAPYTCWLLSPPNNLRIQLLCCSCLQVRKLKLREVK
jgi:hypothetical protein